MDKEGRDELMSEKEALEAMINSSDTLDALAEEAAKLLPKKETLQLDLPDIQNKAAATACDIVESSAGFYLTEDMINSEEYLKSKMKADKAILSSLLRDSSIAEYAICKMLEAVQEGDMQPRTFEVLAGYQRAKAEITDRIAKYVVSMEEQYKQVNADYKNVITEKTEVISVSDGFDNVAQDGSVVQRGSRGMLEKIRMELDRKDREEREAAMAQTILRQEQENKNRRENN